MNQLHGAGRIFLPGHDGQIQLRGALGDHHDVDVGGSQNSEGPGGHSGNSFDAFADKRDDRDIGNAGNAIDTPAVDFLLEFTAQGFDGGVSILPVDDERDVLLGGALRKHEDADPISRCCREYAACDSRHADHAPAFNRNQCHSRNRSHRLHAVLMNRAFGADQSSRHFRSEGVLDSNRNAFVDRRHDGLRMEDLCAEVGHFGGFLI